MYISGKVTHSILTYLAKESIDLEPLFEHTDLPAEFLRDPSCWLEAPKVESFLADLENRLSSINTGESLVESVGLSNHELRSWGVLDSVLKMMMQPQDIFMQPQRFVSYFISPAPPVVNILRKQNYIEFEVPISKEEYPLFTAYMKSVFEVLPCFMGKTAATAKWVDNKISVDWSSAQEDLFVKDMEAPNLNPDIMQGLVASMEAAERELENQKELLSLKDQEIEQLKSRLAQFKLMDSSDMIDLSQMNQENGEELEKNINAPLINIQTQMLKMGDYLTRAQQLITLLVGQNRLDRQVKEAMKRVDWNYIRGRFTHTVQDGVNNVESIRRELEIFKNRTVEPSKGEGMMMVDLDSVLDRAVSSLSLKLKNRHIFIDRMLFYGKNIYINKNSFENLIGQLLELVAGKMNDKGYIRVVSRPKLEAAEVEIVDNGQGMHPSALDQFLLDPFISSVIQEHNVKIKLVSSSSEGSTLIVYLPSIGAPYVKNSESVSPRNHR